MCVCFSINTLFNGMFYEFYACFYLLIALVMVMLLVLCSAFLLNCLNLFEQNYCLHLTLFSLANHLLKNNVAC